MVGRVSGWLAVTVAAGVGAGLLARRRRESLPARQDGGYRTVRAVTVDRSAESIVEYCGQSPHLSAMLDRQVQVRPGDGERRRVLSGGSGTAGWTVEVHADSATGPFHWQVEEGSTPHQGRIELVSAPGARGTEVRVELRYPESRVGHRAAALRGRDLDQLLRTVLRRVKSLIEAGEVVSTMAEPSGRAGITERTTRVVREKLSTGGRP
ncbi:cyclase [Plantactinospora sp. BB1]|uniref:cyclase n=1 Tax=Plantactinospora sp. BB1 TaxID=2071627 RepID=UPI00131F20DE|nr:cyclase [Plantactinospora sp. BB1]